MSTFLSRVTAIDNTVPTRAIDAVRTLIVESPPASDGTHWYELATPARSVFEQVIQHLRRYVPDDFVGAEWWFRATAADLEFPFHFDRDEGIRKTIVSPDLATILYLSSAGGPTVVVHATPWRRSAPTAALAVHPRPGRFAMFPGALLHGVLPGPSSRWPRVTMLVNWWRSEPRMERAIALDGACIASRWRAGKTSKVKLDAIEPTRIFSNAAWRDLIAKQASYR